MSLSPSTSAPAPGAKVLRERLLAACIKHAPPEGQWSRERLLMILETLGVQTLRTRDKTFVIDELERLLFDGESAGWWSVPQVPADASHRRYPSRFTRTDAAGIESARRLRGVVVAMLDEVLEADDVSIQKGALLMHAALVGGLVREDFLRQLSCLGACRHRIEATAGTATIAFALTQEASGAAKLDRQLEDPDASAPCPPNVRCWTPDDVSAMLLHRIIVMDADCTEYEPDRWLAAACARLKQPIITLKELLKRARAWWATQVPSFLYEYLINPRISPSLPHGARERLQTGRMLKGAKAPRERRREEGLVPSKLSLAPATESTLHTQERALAALKTALSAETGKPAPTTDQTLKRLEQWFAAHESFGGWPVLLAYWSRHVLRASKSASTRLKRPGVLRYLGGFGTRWIKLFHDLDPWSIARDPMRFAPEIADRLEALRSEIVHMKSAGVARHGLQTFLRYVSAADGPDIMLDSEWNAVVSSGYVDANVLTPAEYVSLLDWLRTKAGTDSFTAMRNQVIAILAYRLGPRWEELKTRQRRDIAITEDWTGAPCGIIDIRINDWFQGKTSQAPRRLPLEKFLTAREILLVDKFLKWIDQRGAKATSFVFADRERPEDLPHDLYSHDRVQEGMRAVSGDHSLVFHHMRHSAASFFFLRIFTDETVEPAALDWIDSHQNISGAAFESGGVSYASWIMGRRGEHGTRLHLLYRLLGHIDCAMGMYTYVHFADEVLARYRARLAPRVPNPVQARIDGVRKNSVVRRAIRGRAASQSG